MINWDDIIIIELSDIQQSDVKTIVDHTVNTWQSARSYEEKTRDTLQGKLAENVFAKKLREFNEFTYIDYDSFRSDNFEKHAPFDGLLIHRDYMCEIDLDNAFSEINKSVSGSKTMKLDPNLKSFLNKNHILTVEVKSTKVNSRKKASAKMKKDNYTKHLFNEILKDDFLTYPYYVRSSNTIETFDDYVDYIIKQELIVADSKEQLLRKIKKNELVHMNNVYVRVYIDEDMQKAYLVGFIFGENFISTKHGGIIVKKMRRFNKSEKAIYFSVTLNKGYNMANFEDMINHYYNYLKQKQSGDNKQ